MKSITEQIIERIARLIQIAEDGKNSYKDAVQYVEDVNMKDLLLRFSFQRNAYLQELQLLLKNLKSDISIDKTSSDETRYSRVDLKAFFSKDTIISVCISIEEATIKTYKEALEELYISDNIRTIISGQLSGVYNALNLFKKYGTTAVV